MAAGLPLVSPVRLRSSSATATRSRKRRPVYVVRGGTPWVSKDDAKFLAGVVDAIWARAAKSNWRSDAERDAFKKEIDQARAIYAKLAGM